MSSIIELIPTSAAHAQEASALIVENEAVHPSHEGRLLELAHEAHGDLAFMSRPVIRLLALLWDGDGGAPSIDALIGLTASDGCAAEVALLQLYAMEDMRDLIVAKAIESFDTHRLWMFCQMGSQTLDTGTSCDLLSRFSGHGHDMIFSSAYHFLEARGRHELTESYSANVGREDQAFHRAGIVSAVGSAGDGSGAEFAEAAFLSDPRHGSDPSRFRPWGARGGSASRMSSSRPLRTKDSSCPARWGSS